LSDTQNLTPLHAPTHPCCTPREKQSVCIWRHRDAAPESWHLIGRAQKLPGPSGEPGVGRMHTEPPPQGKAITGVLFGKWGCLWENKLGTGLVVIIEFLCYHSILGSYWKELVSKQWPEPSHCDWFRGRYTSWVGPIRSSLFIFYVNQKYEALLLLEGSQSLNKANN
jgi:hypothetical protein